MNLRTKNKILSLMTWLDRREIPAIFDFVANDKHPIKVILDDVVFELESTKDSLLKSISAIKKIINDNRQFDELVLVTINTDRPPTETSLTIN